MKRSQVKKLIKFVIKETISLNEGFDVYGNNKAYYFRTNVWQWRPLMELIEQSNDVYNLNIENLDKWYFNDGYGLETQEECDKLANALEQLIKGQPYNRVIRMKGLPSQYAHAQKWYGIDVYKVIEFIKFLRKCGGFKIW